MRAGIRISDTVIFWFFIIIRVNDPYYLVTLICCLFVLIFQPIRFFYLQKDKWSRAKAVFQITLALLLGYQYFLDLPRFITQHYEVVQGVTKEQQVLIMHGTITDTYVNGIRLHFPYYQPFNPKIPEIKAYYLPHSRSVIWYENLDK